jgi:predicted nucleic acid-binding protein
MKVVEDPPDANSLAEKVGIHHGEASAILLARALKVPVLSDDSDARKFALDFGLEVIGSVGILVERLKQD